MYWGGEGEGDVALEKPEDGGSYGFTVRRDTSISCRKSSFLRLVTRAPASPATDSPDADKFLRMVRGPGPPPGRVKVRVVPLR